MKEKLLKIILLHPNFMSMKNIWSVFSAFLICSYGLRAQVDITSDSEYFNSIRTISTGVPIIAVSPDARAGGMGDVGVATSADANSMYWNPAKLTFLEEGSKMLSMSYTPWLNELVNDIDLAFLSYAYKPDKLQAFGLSMRYFSLGEINFTDNDNNPMGTGQPYEFTLNGAYSRKLGDNFSMAVGLRFIFSDLQNGLTQPGIETKAGNSFAADVGMYYQSDESRIDGGQRQYFALGLNASNIGGKISYGNDADADFIPTNLRLGGAYHLLFDRYNKMSFYMDINKLLVPSPQAVEGRNGLDEDANGNGIKNEVLGQTNVGAFEGIFQSFSDAPGGFDEEIEEIVFNVGVEYWYNDMFALRGGYQYEDEEKGGRRYYTLGAGLKFNVFGLDLAYLIPASPTVRSPLENTLRFTLLFDFENFSGQ